MKVPMMKMTAEKAIKSKGMIGGIVLVGLGFFLISKGQYELGVSQVGFGLGVIGIRDAQQD